MKEVNLIELNDKQFEEFAKLNYETFGEVEGINSNIILQKCREGKLNCLTFFEQEELVASVVYMSSDKTAYYLFIVVSPGYRNKGLGSKLMQILSQKFAGKQQMVEIETLTEKDADSYEERVSRYNFYKRNGYHMTDCKVIINGLLFDLMCTDGDFMKDEYSAYLDVQREFVKEIILL